jgi:hypothetical protein
MKKAFYWFEKGASLNHETSFLEAGKCLMNGKGCKIDMDKAYHYFLIGSDLGQKKCKEFVKEFQIKGISRLAYMTQMKMYSLLIPTESMIEFYDLSVKFE